MKSRELEWKVSYAKIVSLHRAENKGMKEGNGGSSNPIHKGKMADNSQNLLNRDKGDYEWLKKAQISAAFQWG